MGKKSKIIFTCSTNQTNTSLIPKTGRWTKEEHQRFLIGCYLYRNDWKRLQTYIKTRTIPQIRSHAQKYLIKLSRKYSIKLSQKKFTHKKSKHLLCSYLSGKKSEEKLDASKMDKYDKTIFEIFNYYNRDFYMSNLSNTSSSSIMEDNNNNSILNNNNGINNFNENILPINNETDNKYTFSSPYKEGDLSKENNNTSVFLGENGCSIIANNMCNKINYIQNISLFNQQIYPGYSQIPLNNYLFSNQPCIYVNYNNNFPIYKVNRNAINLENGYFQTFHI